MRDYVYITLGKGTSAIVQMGMLLVLAATLGPLELALILAVYSLTATVSAVGDLGLGMFAARERAYGSAVEADQCIRLANRLALFVGALGTVGMGVACVFSPSLLPSLPLFAWSTAERATETRALRLVAEGRVVSVAVMNGARRIAAAALFATAMPILPTDWAFSISLAIAALGTLAVVSFMTPLLDDGGTVSFRDRLRKGLPFALTAISGQMRNLDVPIIAAIIPGTAAAAYGLGSRLASPVMLIYSSISGLVLTRIRGASAKSVRTIVAALLFVPTVLAVLFVSLAEPLGGFLSVFIDWIDTESSLTLLLVASSYIFAGTSIILGSMCQAFLLQSLLMKINLATACVSLIGVAAIASLTSSSVYTALFSLGCFVAQAIVLSWILVSHKGSNRWF